MVKSAKFSTIGRHQFATRLNSLLGEHSSARHAVQYLRPRVRQVLLRLAGGDGIHPEIGRIILASCVKVGALRAEIYTKPNKQDGLRIQSSEVFLGEPGIGKGLGSLWRDNMLEPIKRKLLAYADAEMKRYLSKGKNVGEGNHQDNAFENERAVIDEVKVAAEEVGENEDGEHEVKVAGEEIGENEDGEHEVKVGGENERRNGEKQREKRKTFKYVDGVERLCDMELPFLVELPNGSCEAVFLTASNNCATGMIPIMEYVHGRQTIVDKLGGNGVFLHSHDRTMKAEIFKTTECIPEIHNNAVFQEIYLNLEDSLDWLRTAGNNGSTRRLCYSYGNMTGMRDIPSHGCKILNIELQKRLSTFFDIFRDAHPIKLKFVFDLNQALIGMNVEDGERRMEQGSTNDEDLNTIFDGSGRGEQQNDSRKLAQIKTYAHEIANETFCSADSSIKQLTKNLVSILGQKCAEFNLLHRICTMNEVQLKEHYGTIFADQHGYEEVNNNDITEAVEAVRRSREIFKCFQEANDFELNFIDKNRKMPRTFFLNRNLDLPRETAAMIFSLHYILQSKSEAKSTKQCLKKNSSFKTFGQDVQVIISKLLELGVLETEIKEVRRKRGRNGAEIVRNVRFFKTVLNNELETHKTFLLKYQGIYPVEVFAQKNVKTNVLCIAVFFTYLSKANVGL